MTVDEALLWYFANLQPINIAAGTFACLFSFFKRSGVEAHAIDSIAKGATFCSLPSGIAFLLCAAHPAYVPKISDASLAFFVGGLALLLIPFLDMRKLFAPSP